MAALPLAAADELVGTTEAARRLGIDSKTLLRRIHRGDIRARRSGRAWVIPSSELARIRARRSGAHPAQPVEQPPGQ